MDCEISIAGRIISREGKRAVSQGEILAALGAGSPASVTEGALAEFCRTTSDKYGCEVYVWMDREEYGNENVFNGGSDYTVVNEVCWLCVCESGKEKARERTDHWNEKIEKIL